DTLSSFGGSVASAGDVNGDGYSDVIVGASIHNSYTGSAYIFYGGANMNNVKDKTFFGQNANDNFGTCVSSASDINGDSYSDILISATGYNGSTGIVYLYLGGADMDNVYDLTMNGENLFDYFGTSV
ncbi:MAG: FG-GAP repeat protein, partial [Ignavibacteria bacterium]|nr:FG-GAP repeat protein [Ignavibacteria bacterium]